MKLPSYIIKSTSQRHSLIEDTQGVLIGSMLAALGLTLLAQSDLLIGGTAGLAFLTHYATGVPFGVMFFALNLPFYYLAWKRLGWQFTLKTFLAIAATSGIAEVLPSVIKISEIDPLVAGLFGGLLLGNAVLALFRHRASLGGFGILALYLQERFGWRAGWVQLSLDLLVLFIAFFVVTPRIILYSIVAATVLSLILAINHRRDRYIAV